MECSKVIIFTMIANVTDRAQVPSVPQKQCVHRLTGWTLFTVVSGFHIRLLRIMVAYTKYFEYSWNTINLLFIKKKRRLESVMLP